MYTRLWLWCTIRVGLPAGRDLHVAGERCTAWAHISHLVCGVGQHCWSDYVLVGIDERKVFSVCTKTTSALAETWAAGCGHGE